MSYRRPPLRLSTPQVVRPLSPVTEHDTPSSVGSIPLPPLDRQYDESDYFEHTPEIASVRIEEAQEDTQEDEGSDDGSVYSQDSARAVVGSSSPELAASDAGSSTDDHSGLDTHDTSPSSFSSTGTAVESTSSSLTSPASSQPVLLAEIATTPDSPPASSPTTRRPASHARRAHPPLTAHSTIPRVPVPPIHPPLSGGRTVHRPGGLLPSPRLSSRSSSAPSSIPRLRTLHRDTPPPSPSASSAKRFSISANQNQVKTAATAQLGGRIGQRKTSKPGGAIQDRRASFALQSPTKESIHTSMAPSPQHQRPANFRRQTFPTNKAKSMEMIHEVDEVSVFTPCPNHP
jgi:hypothetical protein